MIKHKHGTFYLGDRIECMNLLPSGSIDLVFTSPPYNLGKDYGNHDDDLDIQKYLQFLELTWKKAYDVLRDGGRLVVNVPSITWRGTWLPLYNLVINQALKIGFIMRTDILWYKQSISKRTAWGSFKSPSNPCIVQPYEFILVFSKGSKKLVGDKSKADITKEEFIEYSNGFWHVKPETALRTHPAPFPERLAYRVLKYYTFKHNIILDMFGGSGTTAVACKRTGREFVYIDNCKTYLDHAVGRVNDVPCGWV